MVLIGKENSRWCGSTIELHPPTDDTEPLSRYNARILHARSTGVTLQTCTGART